MTVQHPGRKRQIRFAGDEGTAVPRRLIGNKAIIHVTDGAQFPDALKGAVVAIGNFDGVHRGHQQVLNAALEVAERDDRPAVVLTFEPHPRSVFDPDTPLFRLTPAHVKAEIFQALGFTGVDTFPFDRRFAGQSAEAFIDDIVIGRLAAAHVVIGFDFHFGHKRRGTPEFLEESGQRHGFGVTRVPAFGDEGGVIVSSSRIRALLHGGKVAEAAGLLGYRFMVEARIIGGRKLGRTLGYPTANMVLAPECDLKPGIYAVRFCREDGQIHDGVASFGCRPTVESDGAPMLEVFLFDFDGDLYGELSTVSFFSFLRSEEKFDGLEALVAQMNEDEAQARAFLASVKPLSGLDRALAFAAGS